MWCPVLRQSAGVALAVLALTASVLVGGAARAAAATNVPISTADDGRMEVHLPASALWVQVTVPDPTDPAAPALARTDAFTLDRSGYWLTDSPVTLTGSPDYVDYPVEVDYRLPGDVVQQATGTFAYRRHTGVATATWDRTFTDYDHRSATLTGTVTTFDPNTATTNPAAAGTSVRISWTSRSGVSGAAAHSATVVTGADGAFQASVTPNGRLVDGQAAVVGLPPDAAPTAAVTIADLETRSLTVRMTGGPANARVHAGATFRVSGTVQRLTSDRGWQPLEGAAVVTTSGPIDYWNYTISGVLGSGLSDSAGRFSYYAKATRTTTFATYARFSDYVGQDTIAGEVHVPVTASYSAPRFTIDAYRDVKATGRLGGPCGHQLLQLQYSKNGRSGWVRIGSAYSADKVDTSSCAFTVQGVGGTDGYYRLIHTESDQLLAFSTGAHRLNRIRTRIASFAMSPSHPYKNARLTGSGRLTQYVKGKWRPLASARVVLVFQPKGDKNWYWVVKGRTNSSGRFSLRGKAYGTGSWGVYYNADAKHFYSETEARRVSVR